MAHVQRQRPDLRAYDTALRLPTTQVVEQLSELLGARLVAYLAGVKETRAVREWATGAREIRGRKGQDVEPLLRTALHISLFLRDLADATVAQTWWQGLNPYLDDRVPLRVLRDGDLSEVGPEVIAAARAFAVSG